MVPFAVRLAVLERCETCSIAIAHLAILLPVTSYEHTSKVLSQRSSDNAPENQTRGGCLTPQLTITTATVSTGIAPGLTRYPDLIPAAELASASLDPGDKTHLLCPKWHV